MEAGEAALGSGHRTASAPAANQRWDAGPLPLGLFSRVSPWNWYRAPSHLRVCACECARGLLAPTVVRRRTRFGEDRSGPAGTMRALSGLRASRALPPQPLLFLCLLAAVRPSSADRHPPAWPFSSVPAREERLARYHNFSSDSHKISLTEHSSVAVVKNITLQSPSNIKLTCEFTASGDPNSVNVSWKKDDEPLENDIINATDRLVYTQYSFTIINSKQLGSYSCIFQEEKEKRGTFNLKVPEIHGKNKPLITYVGDSTVLMCKCQGCFPLNWTWYSSNGSVQVPLDAQMTDKYVINGTSVNETRLKIMNLSEEDQGTYRCHAEFPLGEIEDQLQLVVLSYLVPLKPFLAIAAEVVILVTIILLCEMYTQKKKNRPDDGKEFEQIEQLKSDDSNGIENNVPRHRKNESVASE
ncbi:embigin [Artibeus jamaicensis]|uniref:embigin n=1 Tax=Artibeus jamaicensis TaxID=9417 RepID=UPI00235A6482|nr:embigin [Artibeus jamaicensis]